MEQATNMAVDVALPRQAFEKKYSAFTTNVRTAYQARTALRTVDAVVSRLENLFLRKGLSAPIDRPIFILGNFRSGTTFLESVLAQHPALGHFTYLTSVFPLSPRFGHAMRRVIPGFMDPMIPPHQPNMVVNNEWPFEAEILWRFCKNNLWSNAESNVLDADFSDPRFEQLLIRAINKQLSLQGRSRFIHKNPTNTVRLGFLSRVFPSARFVHIVRHPLRVLRSQLDMVAMFERALGHHRGANYSEAFANLFLPPAPMFLRTHRHQEIKQAMTRDKALALAMSFVDVEDCVQEMTTRNKLEDRVHTLRYEDLMKNFDGSMHQVLQFVGLDDVQGSKVVAAHAQKVDKGLVSNQSPLPSFSTEVHQTLAPLLTRFGY